MPTLSNKKTVKTPPTPLRRRKLFWLIVVIVLLACGGYTTSKVLQYRHDRDIAAERARFEQADKDIQKVAAEIIAATGQPYKIEKDKSCSEPSHEAWQGDFPITCSLFFSAFYTVDNLGYSNKLLDQVKSTVSGVWKFKEVQSKNTQAGYSFMEFNQKDYNPRFDYQSVLFKFNNIPLNMECDVVNVLYKASTPPYEEYLKSDIAPLILAVNVDCGDEVIAPFYSMR